MLTEMKLQLRSKIKNERRLITKDKKAELDDLIAKQLIQSNILNKAKLVLIYLSTDIEVGTSKIIDYCMNNYVTIAVPRCIGKRTMNFYYYNKQMVLEKSEFGIYEPPEDKNNMVNDFKDAVCIVPGLLFDKNGYRLGYGGGFYDAFLSKYPEIKTVGICYSQHIIAKLPTEVHDKHVDFVVTEKNMEACNG